MEAFKAELNKDESWKAASKYFSARVALKNGDAVGTVDIRDGVAVSAIGSAHPLGADITITGPDHEWKRVQNGETDWFQGMSPGLGELGIEGDAVGALRNVKTMWLTLAAVSRVGRALPAPPAYSPAPKPSGKPTKGHYIEIDGIRTYYEEAGEGYPIICFHAACQDTLMYRHVLDGLSDQFRVISVDAPSHAKSLEPKDGEFKSLTSHAAFNEKLMDKLGLVKPVIIGCSMSGNQVLELGSRRPDGYAAIISSEGADYTPTVSQFLLDMLLVNGQQILEGWSQSLTGNRTPPDRAREVVWQIRKVNPEVMRGDLVGYAGFDKRDAVGKIKSPVLLLRGDGDWLVSQQQVEETAARIPGSEISVLAGTGHYPMIENPYEFNEAVRTFLHKNGVGKAA
ncbi:alpha/beta hydrolase [Mesorhizobium sp. NZP2298]|nr:alpha/beta hydrolase [Mesorhizobium sp. NZP2298]